MQVGNVSLILWILWASFCCAITGECSKAKAALVPAKAAIAPSGCSRWQGKWYFNGQDTGELDGEGGSICRSDKAGSIYIHPSVKPCSDTKTQSAHQNTISIIHLWSHALTPKHYQHHPSVKTCSDTKTQSASFICEAMLWHQNTLSIIHLWSHALTPKHNQHHPSVKPRSDTKTQLASSICEAML